MVFPVNPFAPFGAAALRGRTGDFQPQVGQLLQSPAQPVATGQPSKSGIGSFFGDLDFSERLGLLQAAAGLLDPNQNIAQAALSGFQLTGQLKAQEQAAQAARDKAEREALEADREFKLKERKFGLDKDQFGLKREQFGLERQKTGADIALDQARIKEIEAGLADQGIEVQGTPKAISLPDGSETVGVQLKSGEFRLFDAQGQPTVEPPIGFTLADRSAKTTVTQNVTQGEGLSREKRQNLTLNAGLKEIDSERERISQSTQDLPLIETFLGALERVQAAGGTTGAGEELKLQVKKFAKAITEATGLSLPKDIDQLIADQELLQALGKRLALSKTELLPGQISNYENQILKDVVPGLGKTVEGNLKLAKIQIGMTRTKQERLQAKKNFLLDLKGEFTTAGFQDEWEDFSEFVPTFDTNLNPLKLDKSKLFKAWREGRMRIEYQAASGDRVTATPEEISREAQNKGVPESEIIGLLMRGQKNPSWKIGSR